MSALLCVSAYEQACMCVCVCARARVCVRVRVGMQLDNDCMRVALYV